MATDRPDWHETIKRLGHLGIGFKVRMDGTHIKVGSVNYYPGKGTVYIDGEKSAFPKKGFAFLLTVLENQRYYRPKKQGA